MKKKLFREYYVLVGIVVLLSCIIFLASCLPSSSVPLVSTVPPTSDPQSPSIAPPASDAPEEKEKLSELSVEECLGFITSSGIKIPVELNDEETIGTFVKELIVRAEEMPDIPRPFGADAPIYLAESVRKAVNGYYGIQCDKYNIVWEPSFDLSFEERVEGQQILSGMPEGEFLEFLISSGVIIPDMMQNDYLGEFVREVIVQIERYPYTPSPYNGLDVGYLLVNIQKVINAYYDIYNERPKLSDLSDEECLEFIASYDIEIPETLKDGYTAVLVSEMILRADAYPYHTPPYKEPGEMDLYENVLKAVQEYYSTNKEKQQLSKLSGDECLEFITSHGIELSPVLKNDYVGELVRSIIAYEEEHPYLHLIDYARYYSNWSFSEDVRKVVNEYYGAYEEPKLSEMSVAEGLKFVESCSIRIPNQMSIHLGEGGMSKELITLAVESPNIPMGYFFSSVLHIYLGECIRKSVNEYYFLYYDNYDIDWRPEFEPGYYDSATSGTE